MRWISLLLLGVVAPALAADKDGDGFDELVDCDDNRFDVNPIQPLDPVGDGVDQNCDGKSDFDADGDGFDSIELVNAHWPLGRPACPANGPDFVDKNSVDYVDPALGCGPALDCNDWDADVHPMVDTETCEPILQDDNDCDGDVNTASGGIVSSDGVNPDPVLESWLTDADAREGSLDHFFVRNVKTFDELYQAIADVSELPTNATGPYLLDSDEDTYPSPPPAGMLGYALCDLNDTSLNWVAGGPSDCDDTDARRNAGAIEVCDGVDNDCNEEVDELRMDRNPANDECSWFTKDSDLDGYGAPLEMDGDNALNALCVCDAWVQNADVVATAEANDCVDLDNNAGVVEEGVITTCYHAPKELADCDDNDDYIRPAHISDDPVEVMDGIDHDCDGFVSILELDCDGDGVLPMIPGTLVSMESLGEPAPELMEASELQLDTCVGKTAPDFPCYEMDSIEVVCDEASGFWMADLRQFTNGEWEGPWRNKEEGILEDGRDCDDQCHHRFLGNDEICDGQDNDCRGTIYEQPADVDGFPRAMDPTKLRTGFMSPDEADMDNDGYPACLYGVDIRSTETVQIETVDENTCWILLDGRDCDDTNPELNEDCGGDDDPDTGDTGDTGDNGGGGGGGGGCSMTGTAGMFAPLLAMLAFRRRKTA